MVSSGSTLLCSLHPMRCVVFCARSRARLFVFPSPVAFCCVCLVLGDQCGLFGPATLLQASPNEKWCTTETSIDTSIDLPMPTLLALKQKKWRTSRNPSPHTDLTRPDIRCNHGRGTLFIAQSAAPPAPAPVLLCARLDPHDRSCMEAERGLRPDLARVATCSVPPSSSESLSSLTACAADRLVPPAGAREGADALLAL